ncbi:amidohydrolase family protein [Plantactinospora sp. B5E13]|uniref:amidohydrolase family protein n=1 Tax=Plantactinospora sp. B5E13 TaxID=3153758 RepID=UPI00325EABFC
MPGPTRSAGSPNVPSRTSTRSSRSRCTHTWRPASPPSGTWATGAAPYSGGGTGPNATTCRRCWGRAHRSPASADTAGRWGGEASGVDGIREAVRLRAAADADLIKVMASGGVFTPGTDTTRPQFTDRELAAAVNRAHELGLPVTAHAHALNAVEQALHVGVDGIEHCTCVTATGAHVPDRLADRLAASGVAVCATLGTDPGVVTPPEVVAMAAAAGLSEAALRDGVATLHRAGVRLVAGSDAGLGPAKPHGVLPETVVEYVACGIPATAALAAATSVGAEVCGLGRRRGRVRPGFDADLLVVDGDPTSDITALRRPLAVYRAGHPVRG